MSSPLQKSPYGLLGAFALKVLGRNPDKFGDTVTPAVDVYDQYLADTFGEVRLQATIAIGARTAAVSHVAPQGFAYRILAIASAFTLDAADVALTATAITSLTVPANGISGVTMEPQGTMVVNGATGLFRSLGHYLPRPLFLPPGYQMIQRVYLSANVTAAVTVNFNFLAQRIEL